MICPQDVVPNNILAVLKPNVRVKTVIHHDIVLHQSIKPFAVFDPAIQAKIVANLIAG